MCDPPEEDLYVVLGASPSDSVQHLRNRYQQLVLLYHPDRADGERSSEAASSLRRFLQINVAWKVLSDPNRRRQYDLQRRASELKPGLDGGLHGLSGQHDLGPGAACVYIHLSLWRRIQPDGGRGADSGEDGGAGARRTVGLL
ncbi:dnaJ homolog subfamily C member 24-like [Thalassophryne amazonica]|uniref:dnaJ homolog subfamily C member 24-like n=1 Tax=Thalassophryne amazonica TaxID=390379 RepID=UPI0014717844|nr:dnaJ homolog subfamily C member 24-like [Thalassophryne amazonica]